MNMRLNTSRHSVATASPQRERKISVTLITIKVVIAAGLLFSQSRASKAQDVVLDWNDHAANAIVGVANQPPPRGILRLAMVHLAIYDAVNAVEGSPFKPYAVTPHVVTPASSEAAAATAAHDVLVALFPNQRTDLDAKYVESLAAIPDGPAKTNGISVGQQTAAGLLLIRANDGRDAVVTYSPATGPGAWIPTPPALLPASSPEIAHVQPWLMESPSQFRTEPPPNLNSKLWQHDYGEVKELGGATGSSRTPEQTDIGRFWSDHPILQWNRAWRGIAIGRGLSLINSARLFAMLAAVGSDSYIGCWDSKYLYNFWRPVTAIRAGDTDGRDRTEPDPAWISQIANPNHPEYPSAHGCFSGAVTRVLKQFFGSDTFSFTIDSLVPGLASPVRHYDSFSQALDEILNARIYGGIHYRNSTEKGSLLGKQLSRFATKHFFKPSRKRNSVP